MRDPTEAAQTAQDDELDAEWPDVAAYILETTKDVVRGEGRDESAER